MAKKTQIIFYILIVVSAFFSTQLFSLVQVIDSKKEENYISLSDLTIEEFENLFGDSSPQMSESNRESQASTKEFKKSFSKDFLDSQIFYLLLEKKIHINSEASFIGLLSRSRNKELRNLWRQKRFPHFLVLLGAWIIAHELTQFEFDNYILTFFPNQNYFVLLDTSGTLLAGFFRFGSKIKFWNMNKFSYRDHNSRIRKWVKSEYKKQLLRKTKSEKKLNKRKKSKKFGKSFSN